MKYNMAIGVVISAAFGLSSATGGQGSNDVSGVPSILGTPAAASLSGDGVHKIKIVTGRQAASHQARVGAINALGKDISRAGINELYTFLNGRVESFPGEDNLLVNAIKNDTLQELIAQEKLPADLLPQILAMYRDPGMDTLWRDYCLQHLVLYYERRWKPDDDTRLNDPERQTVLATYEEALQAKGQGFAGTALLGLTRLSEQYPEINRSVVADKALALARNEETDNATRITAVSLCGVLGQKQILPMTRMIVHGKRSTPLRLAAIGVLGLLGTQQDLELLESAAASDDKETGKAAHKAAARLRKRQRS